MSNTQEQVPPRPRRQYIEADVSFDHPSESRPSKRLKPSIDLHSAEFYDSLTKVWLTRRALKELDRRTSQVSSPQHPVSSPQCVYPESFVNKIQRFAKHGGPDLCDLRGYPAPTYPNLEHVMNASCNPHSSHSRQSLGTTYLAPIIDPICETSNKRSSAYDNNFEQHLVDHHIYMNNRRSEPGNLTTLRQTLTRPRHSLSISRFSNDAFKDFQRINEDAINEDDIMRTVVPILAGNSNIPNRQNLLFTQLDSMTNGTTVLPKPDFYDGICLENIDMQVRQDLESYIIPTGHRIAPAAPNFFLEVKSHSGGIEVAKRQACYDGAIGARAMLKLHSYRQGKPLFDDNAYTVTSTYYAGIVRIYTTHVTSLGSNGPLEYHMSLVGGWDTVGDPETCRRGLTAFRNSREWAQEQRNILISAANRRATITNAVMLPSQDNKVSGLADEQYTTFSQGITYAPVRDLADHFQNYTLQQKFRRRYTNSEPSTSQVPGYDDPMEVQLSPLEPTMYDHTLEPDLPEEPPLDIYVTPTVPNKHQRHRVTKKTFVRATGYDDFMKSELPTFESAKYNHIPESELPDELSLHTCVLPTVLNKIRSGRVPKKTVIKASPHGKSPRKKRFEN